MVTIGSTGTSVTIVTMLEIDMPTILEPPLERVVTQINGVSLLTTEGKRRARYSDKERLQILGATPEELDATLDLFAPRRPLLGVPSKAIIVLASMWTTEVTGKTFEPGADACKRLCTCWVCQGPPGWSVGRRLADGTTGSSCLVIFEPTASPMS